MASKTVQTGTTGRMLGTANNPVMLRCPKCCKNFEFRGGKLNEVKRNR